METLLFKSVRVKFKKKDNKLLLKSYLTLKPKILLKPRFHLIEAVSRC